MEGGWIVFNILGVLVAAWTPYFASYLGEKGKRLATKEDIANVLAEVRRVTHETETVKTLIAAKWDLYSQLLRICGELINAFTQAIVYDQNHKPELRDAALKQGSDLQKELGILTQKAFAFASTGVNDAVNSYVQDANLEKAAGAAWCIRENERLRRLQIEKAAGAAWCIRENERLRRLQTLVAKAARDDLAGGGPAFTHPFARSKATG